MSSPLIGVIPAAGSGIRARPYTYEQHKGMFLLDGKSNIERHVDFMRDEMKIDEIVIVLGYMGNTISDYFGDGTEFGVRINYVANQNLDKGWAWSVLLAKQFLAGRHACVMLADEFYLDTNLGGLADFDFAAYSAVLPVMSVDDEARIKKNFSVERDGARVIRLIENPVSTPNDLLGMATFIVNPEVLSKLEEVFDAGRPTLDFVTFIDDLIRDGHQVAAYELEGEYINLNDVASMEAAQDAVIRSRLSKGDDS